jgi:hypothetical protein
LTHPRWNAGTYLRFPGKVDHIRVLDELREIVVEHILNVLRGRGSTPCAGIIMQDTNTSANQSIEQYWFLREGEAGLHMFTRVYYYSESQPFLNGMGELRTLFWPNSALWTHLFSSEGSGRHCLRRNSSRGIPMSRM